MAVPSTTTSFFARFIRLLITFVGLEATAQAQNLATWSFGVAGVAASPVDINVSGTDAVFTNAGSTTALANSRFTATQWTDNALNLSRYFEVSVTPNANYNLTVNQLSFNVQNNSGGPTNYEIHISTNNFSTYTSFGTNAITGSSTTTAFTVNNIVRVPTTVGVRVYFWGATDASKIVSIGSAAIRGTAQRPALITTPNSLTTGFATTLGVPSAAQTYILTGSNLISDATLAPPTGFEISLSPAGSFVSAPGTLIVTQTSSGTIAATPIYVRLTGAASGTFTGNSTNNATGAITQNVALKGVVAAALPVTLVSFRGHATGNSVILTWSTASEQASEQFVVQRSADAAEFVSVGSRQAAGNTHQQQYYSLTDESPRSGVNYYRLKQVDRDGSTVYSKAIAVRVDANQPYASLAENPTNGQTIQLRLYQMEAPQVRLSSLTGQCIAGELSLRGNTEAIYTPASALAPGLYIITVQEGNAQQAMKVLVK